MNFFKVTFLIILISNFITFSASEISGTDKKPKKRIAYLVSDINIPFWEIMSRGIIDKASELNYLVDIYSAENTKKIELQNILKAIKSNVDAIVLSPINSSSAVTILKLASSNNIPVVISDIGADKGDFVSYISSNNEDGAYKIGKILIKKLKKLHLDKNSSIGVVAIPQKRVNGKARTAGFMKAMHEAGIKKADMRQQSDFSYKETYNFSKELIDNNPNLRALWLQGSNRYQAALDAIEHSGKKGKILLVVFDAEPEFLELIPKGIIIGAAMQQPYLFGEKSITVLNHLFNNRDVKKYIQLPILPVSTDNINENIKLIKRNVLGLKEKATR